MLTLSASSRRRLESLKLFKPSIDINKLYDLVNQQINCVKCKSVKINSSDDIDLAVNNCTKLIQSVAWSSTLKSQPLFHNPRFLLKYIRCIIVEKHIARANFQRARLPSH